MALVKVSYSVDSLPDVIENEILRIDDCLDQMRDAGYTFDQLLNYYFQYKHFKGDLFKDVYRMNDGYAFSKYFGKPASNLNINDKNQILKDRLKKSIDKNVTQHLDDQDDSARGHGNVWFCVIHIGAKGTNVPVGPFDKKLNSEFIYDGINKYVNGTDFKFKHPDNIYDFVSLIPWLINGYRIDPVIIDYLRSNYYQNALDMMKCDLNSQDLIQF